MKKLLKLFLALLLFLNFFNETYSQTPDYSLVAKNFSLLQPNVLEFDMYILWTNPQKSEPFNYGTCQYILTINPLAGEGQAWAVQNIGSDLPPSMQPPNIDWNPATSQLRFAGNFPGTIFQVGSIFPGTKVVRTRITTSISSFPAVPLNCVWRNSGTGLFTRISYLKPNGQLMLITDSISHSVEGGNICLNCDPLEPQLVAPLDNATDVSTPIIFSWLNVPKAVNFTIQVAADSTMNSLLVNDSLLSDTSIVLDKFTGSTKYYWLVKARDSLNVLHSSQIRNFITRPVLISPSNGSSDQNTTLNFMWHRTNSAKRFTFRLSSDSLQNNIIILDTNLTDTSKLVEGLLHEKVYYWSIVSFDSLNNAFASEVWNFNTTRLLISPANNATITSTAEVSFVWHKNAYATKYTIEISTDSLIKDPVYVDSTITDTFKTLSGLDFEKKYYWRIIAEGNTNSSAGLTEIESSSVWAFSIQNFLLSPANNSASVLRPVRFIWQKLAGANKYFLKVSEDSTFSNLILADSTTNDTSLVENVLEPDQTYYWKVLVRNTSGSIAQSLTWTFTTTDSVIRPTYELLARNISMTTDNQFEFDIFLRWTNAGVSLPFNYGSCQFCLTVNPACIAGQTWTMTNIGSDLPPSLQPANMIANTSTARLQYAGNLPGTIFQVSSVFPGTKVIRTRITTNASIFPIVPLNLAWRNSGAGLTTKISYLDPNGFGVFITNPDGHIVEFNYTLPVEVSSFTSTVSRNNITLNWSTSKETNNQGFDIERKLTSGPDWVKVGIVSGYGTTTEQKNYTFTDRISTGTYSYRLKQIDFNGNFHYFDLANEVAVGIPEQFNLSQNYPNPFNPTTKFDFDVPHDGLVTIKIYDLSGKEVATLLNENKQAGYYTVQFNGSNISSGMYFYRITSNEFVMTRKMVLVK